MILDAPKTQEDVERMKRQLDNWGRLYAALWVSGMILILVFSFMFSSHHIPGPLQPFWNPAILVIVFGIPFGFLLRASPLGKKMRPHLPLSHAINAYYLARKAYAKWLAERDKRQLIRAAHFIKHAEEYLSAVPEFRQFKEEVLVTAKEQGCG